MIDRRSILLGASVYLLVRLQPSLKRLYDNYDLVNLFLELYFYILLSVLVLQVAILDLGSEIFL